jgi:HlyD family secretion protein
MSRPSPKQVFWGVGGLLLLAALVYGFLPDPLQVETALVERGSMEVLVEEEGETEAEDRYVVSAPANAHLRRIELEVGDSVDVGQIVAYLEPPRASALDPLTRTEAESRVAAARSSLLSAEETVRAAAAEEARAVAERERVERLHAVGSATTQALEEAFATSERAVADRESAEARVESVRAVLMAARSAIQVDGSDAGAVAPGALRSPVAGRVLAVHQESAGPVSAGQPLVEIGDPDRLEVTVDVLSADAVRIHPGTPVRFEDWGGEGVLEGRVKRVEPQGFTEVSSLGVEEKRVWVVAELVSPLAARGGLGVGYRVLADFVVWEGDDVLKVPTAALFRVGDGWRVFVVEGGRASLRAVEVGQQGGLEAEVLSGLSEGERVVVHPPNETEEGARVEWRED